MSVLLRNGKIETDEYIELTGDDAPGPGAKIIVSLERWQRDGATLDIASRTVGVRLPNTAAIEQVWSSIADRPLLALDFPAFGDGRAYSQARLLRDRFGYRGEIRALGQAVVRDQLQSMRRVGIDSFRLRADQDAQVCLQTLGDFDLAYQKASDSDALPIVQRLRAQTLAAN
jgi:uncharacterized protein (DUF934 family)